MGGVFRFSLERNALIRDTRRFAFDDASDKRSRLSKRAGLGNVDGFLAGRGIAGVSRPPVGWVGVSVQKKQTKDFFNKKFKFKFKFH